MRTPKQVRLLGVHGKRDEDASCTLLLGPLRAGSRFGSLPGLPQTMRVRDIRILLAGPTSMESDASARSTTHPSLTSLLRDTEEVRHCCGDTRAKGTVKGASN